MHSHIVLRLIIPRRLRTQLPLVQPNGGLMHLAVASGHVTMVPGCRSSVRNLAPLPREGRPPRQRWLRLVDSALVARAHEFAFARFAAELAIGVLQIDVAVLWYLAGLRVVVGAASVEALRLLVAEVLVHHVAVSEVLIQEMGAHGVEVTTSGSLSASTLTLAFREVLLEVHSLMHVQGAVVHALGSLVSEVFLVGARGLLLRFHAGQWWKIAA